MAKVKKVKKAVGAKGKAAKAKGKKGGKSPAAAAAAGGVRKDARLKIIAKSRSKMVDARDKLVKMSHAQGVDARSKITKIRNLKKGMLDVKTTSGGAITITKMSGGKTLLTTKKKAAAGAKKAVGGANSSSKKNNDATRCAASNKNVTRTVGRGGVVSLKTKNKTSSTLTGVAKAKPPPPPHQQPPPSRKSTSRPKHLTRTIRGEMSEAARLDMELLNTKVDPIILKRTVNQDVASRQRRMSPPGGSTGPLRSSTYRGGSRRSPSPIYTTNRMRSRSRSPIDVDMYDASGRSGRSGRGEGRGGGGYHYDDPRRELEREESYARRLHDSNGGGGVYGGRDSASGRTMADRFGVSSSGGGGDSMSRHGGGVGGHHMGMGVSPLEGAKVVVSNLQNSVSKEDLFELFGDVGALKRVKVTTPGSAEVVFVERADAQKAVEIYHNRQLDGKAMKCQIVGAGGLEPSIPNSSYRLPGGSSSGGKDSRHGSGGGARGSDTRVSQIPTVELNSIHRALFNDRKQPELHDRYNSSSRGGGGGGSRHRDTSRERRSRRY